MGRFCEALGGKGWEQLERSSWLSEEVRATFQMGASGRRAEPQTGSLQPIATSGLPSFYGPSNVSADLLRLFRTFKFQSNESLTKSRGFSCSIFVFFFYSKNIFFQSIQRFQGTLNLRSWLTPNNFWKCASPQKHAFSSPRLSLHLGRDWHLHWAGDLRVFRPPASQL